tara:strand:+ start:1182 stop:2657 length:1476 start_codon:yes stop_codon:yes gene_type:complete
MATSFKQRPLYGNETNWPSQNIYEGVMPVGQPIIFTLANSSVVSNNYNVKFVAEVSVRRSGKISDADLTAGTYNIGTFKTTPNDKGNGIFDFRSILESYVSSDNQGSSQTITGGSYSKFKGVNYSSDTPHPIHVIDRFCQTRNGTKWIKIRFYIEGSTTATGAVIEIANTELNSINMLITDGVLQHNDYIKREAGNYGYDMGYYGKNFYPNFNSKFITNAPTTLYANKEDYGTLAFYQYPNGSYYVNYITFNWYDSSGSLLGTKQLNVNWTNGSGSSSSDNAATKINYFGAYPGNLRNWVTAFESDIDDISYYTIQANNTSAGSPGKMYTVYINCPDLRGYESVRLCWLNQWGVWDYYTFTKKSVKSSTTNRTTYTQSTGTWNESTFDIYGYKGGRKNFRVNSTERFQINTDFITEKEGRMFQDLIASPEVYKLNGFDSSDTAPHDTITGRYVEPVLMTTSNYIEKTIANDKLIQYTFELERNKTQRTQTV